MVRTIWYVLYHMYIYLRICSQVCKYRLLRLLLVVQRMHSYEATGIFKALAWIWASYVICSVGKTVTKWGSKSHSNKHDDTWQPGGKAFLGLLFSAHRNHERIMAIKWKKICWDKHFISQLCHLLLDHDNGLSHFSSNWRLWKTLLANTSFVILLKQCLSVHLLICLDWNIATTVGCISSEFCTDISGHSAWMVPWSLLAWLTFVVKVLIYNLVKAWTKVCYCKANTMNRNTLQVKRIAELLWVCHDKLDHWPS